MPQPSVRPISGDDWRPTATIAALQLRAKILRGVRTFFDDAGFFEVQTPCLSNETVVDAHLEPLSLTLGTGRRLYMQTSPEAAMKRILAAGAHSIYQIGPVFRDDERGPLHNLEFTMLEWYRRGDSMRQGMDCLEQLVQRVTGLPTGARTTYRQLFRDFLELDPLEIPLDALRRVVERLAIGFRLEGEEDRDTLLDALMGLVIQPRLRGVVTVSNYPLSQAALARRSDEDPATAERFELFIDSVEIANGYAELLDAEQLLERTAANNAARIASGRRALPAPQHLVAAMRQGLPLASGTAVGLDRLVMSAAGVDEIDAVIPFPLDRA